MCLRDPEDDTRATETWSLEFNFTLQIVKLLCDGSPFLYTQKPVNVL